MPCRRSLRSLALVAVLAVGGAGCGDDSPSTAPADCTRIEGGEVTLVAENLQWSDDCFRAPVGTTITFTVENRDRSVGHNLAIDGPSGDAKTDIERGPVTQTLVYEATAPGPHPFECEPHASMMDGTLWIDP
ncbi:MAG TPA: plastocyanin/azurin family copper-binding protein [Iamia sp.]